jgi:nitroreductase
MEAYRATVNKRDQRAFLERPIPDEPLRRILQAGRMAGSSKNREPNRFIVVRDREQVGRLAALGPVAAWLARAPVVIVIAQVQEHQFDAGRCAQNMMLAAWSEGIGSCPAHLPEAEVAKILDIPPDLAVNRVIGFGYVDPARGRPPTSVARRRLPLTVLVHWESYSRTSSGAGPPAS